MPHASRNFPADATDAGQLVRGKWVILAIVALAVAAGAFSWFYFAWLQRRPLALWGSHAAALMMRAPTARAYRLEPMADAAAGDAAPGQPVFAVDGEPFRGTAARDVSRAKGFLHIRQSLVHNASFAWDEPAGDCQPKWEYAIEFEDRGERAVVAFAFNCGRIALVESDRTASIRPAAAEIKSFLVEQFPEAAR
ncbi:MAG: hypothetical protein HYX69_07825 [Planctomycetia bacterium]|nr:hypothetical protein [Planctomycetia bacterium]